LIHATGVDNRMVLPFWQFEQGVFQGQGRWGIEAGEGLVHDDQFGIVKDRADKLHFLLHAFREFFDFLVHPGSQFEALAPSMSTFR